TDPYRLLYTFMAADDDLDGYLSTGPLNTDDRPVLSYTTYGANLRPTIAGNLFRLQARRTDVGRFVRGTARQEMLLRHYLASNEAVLGHIASQVGATQAALAHYMKGSQTLPADVTLRELVRSVYTGLYGTTSLLGGR